MDESSFKNALDSAKIPILVLDQKWHRLFAISGKPEDVKEVEAELNTLLQKQGKLNTDLKGYKKVKSDLMQSIVENMDAKDENKSTPENQKKAETDRRLMDELNAKMDACEDELLDLPPLIQEKNRELMMLTMAFSYDKLRTNEFEIQAISEWIQKFRVELKRNIIRKQNREINNKEIYSYMHDIFGKDVITLFDVHYEDMDVVKAEQKAKEELAAESKAVVEEESKELENYET
ncbi:MAG: hypothetical protein II169_01995 [Lachnospiraceae bacterium]|nr:hypothetical protein [Lachnospiraceae bacterium]